MKRSLGFDLLLGQATARYITPEQWAKAFFRNFPQGLNFFHKFKNPLKGFEQFIYMFIVNI